MSEDASPLVLSALGKLLCGLREWSQRAVRFSEAIVALEPTDAARAADRIVARAFVTRDVASRVVAESALLAAMLRSWPDEHRRATHEAASRAGHALAEIFFDDPPEPPTEDEFPVPDYGTGRPLTLGERRSLAARPGRKTIERALLDPHPMVVSKLLANPKLRESDVLLMAARRPAPAGVLAEIALHPRWRRVRRVAAALAHNASCPPAAALSLLPSLDAREVLLVAADGCICDRVREGARRLLVERSRFRKLRPPNGRYPD